MLKNQDFSTRIVSIKPSMLQSNKLSYLENNLYWYILILSNFGNYIDKYTDLHFRLLFERLIANK